MNTLETREVMSRLTELENRVTAQQTLIDELRAMVQGRTVDLSVSGGTRPANLKLAGARTNGA